MNIYQRFSSISELPIVLIQIHKNFTLIFYFLVFNQYKAINYKYLRELLCNIYLIVKIFNFINFNLFLLL